MRALVIIFIVTLACLFFQSNNLWMGDGYTMQGFINMDFEQIVNSDGFWISPLTILLLIPLGFWFVSTLCGVVYLAYVYKMTEIDEKYIVFALLPIIQLFTGYVEVYSVVYTVSLATIYYWLVGNTKMVQILSGLAFLSHFIIGFPILWLGVVVSKGRKQALLFFGSLFYIALILFFSGRGDTVMPLTGYYSLFASSHLLELLYLFGGLFYWILFNEAGGAKRVDTPFLCVGDNKHLEWWSPVAGAIFMTCVLQSHLGMFRDWDLFSMALLPITAWYVYRTKQIRIEVLILMLCGLSFFLYFNSEDRQEAMLAYMLDAPQYSSQYRDGKTIYMTQFIFSREVPFPVGGAAVSRLEYQKRVTDANYRTQHQNIDVGD